MTKAENSLFCLSLCIHTEHLKHNAYKERYPGDSLVFFNIAHCIITQWINYKDRELNPRNCEKHVQRYSTLYLTANN